MQYSSKGNNQISKIIPVFEFCHYQVRDKIKFSIKVDEGTTPWNQQLAHEITELLPKIAMMERKML